jgi:hypothetical protein
MIDLIWGDGEQKFALPIGQLRELQNKCDAGPAKVLGRLGSTEWFIDDIRETIRLGLIGGGKTPAEAHMLVVRYIDERPGGLMESRLVAQVALMKALVGDPSDPVGEPQAAETATATDASSSPPSTDGAPS